MEQTLTAPLGWRGSLATVLEHPLHRLRIGYAAWLFGIFCYFLPAATWNPVSHFDLTRSILERGSVDIDAYFDNTGDRVKLGASGGGLIEVFRDITRNARTVRYVNAVQGSGVFGQVQRTGQIGDSVTDIGTLILAGAKNFLTTPPFNVGYSV